MKLEAMLKRRKRVGACIEWTGRKDRYGYGRVQRDGRDITASRALWALLEGDPGPNLYVLHTCGNRACVSFEHLYLGTHQANRDDRADKDREFRKLSNNEVLLIRELAYRDVAEDVLGECFGVRRNHIMKIVTGRSRKRVGGPIRPHRTYRKNGGA